jgi:hypothetical protein
MASDAPTLVVTVVLGVLIVGLVLYSAYGIDVPGLSSLSTQNAALSGQVGNQDNQLLALDQQLSTQAQQLASLNGQISSLNQQVSTLEQKTLSVVTMTNTLITFETTTSLLTTTQTSLVTTTVTSLVTTTQTSISAVPQSTLIITGNSYNNVTHTFTFQVQNTQNYIVYAQLSASLWGQGNVFCNGQVGTFVSQVYTFNPGAVTTAQFNLALGSYVGFCGGNPLSSIEANFVIAPTTVVSPTYTFTVVPNYTFP